MFKRLSLFLVICIYSIVAYPQSQWYHYNWESASANDFKGLQEYVYKFDLQKYKDNMYVGKNYEKISYELSKAIGDDIKHGKFYSSIGVSNEYLQQVLKTVINDTSVTNKIRIILCRDTEFNASMNESGILRLNVGAVARLKNESELAMIMAHEVSHFLNEDVIKSVGRMLEMEAGSSFIIPVLANAFVFFWNTREDEASADFRAIKYMKSSPFSLKSGSNVLRILKRLEIRSEIINGKSYIPFTTHPDPGDRLKQVVVLSNDSLNIGKKNFVVDSSAFGKLKKNCFEETINIALLDNNYDEAIELTFTKYLFDTLNQRNLAVLIESLRRKIIKEKKDVADGKSFILGQYQTKHVKDSENYSYLNEKTPTILNYLTKGFLDLTKDDIALIKASDLLDPSKIEFSTNKEAYDYFIAKSIEMNCKVCEHYKFFGSSVIDPNEYVAGNDLFRTNDFILRNSGLLSGNEMIVLMPAEITSTTLLNHPDSSEQNSFSTALTSQLSSSLGKKIVKLEELSFSDQHMVLSLIAMSTGKEKILKNSGIKNQQVDWMQSSPELYGFFKKNNISDLYVCAPEITITEDKKQIENFGFYKMSIPREGRNSFSTKMYSFNSKAKDYSSFINKLSKEFSYFYSLTK